MDSAFVNKMDAVRRDHGYLSIEETVALNEAGNIVFDAFSTLISQSVVLGRGNLFYPGVTVDCRDQACIRIGGDNIFHGGTRIFAELGAIEIGDGNQFGDGGFIAKTLQETARLVIGNGGRYCAGATVIGSNTLGSGSQVLGAIMVEGCTLDAGGTYTNPDPDERAAVLKGQGRARNISLGVGEVIAGQGIFSTEHIQRQTEYHPRK